MSRSVPGVRWRPDHWLLVEAGRITGVQPAAAFTPDAAVWSVEDQRGRLLMPGFIDTHVHCPQLDVIASFGTALLDWLNTYTFPCESQFADKAHADQVAKIAASMAEFGWTVPCLVAADGELIAGHGRVLAAARLGLAEAPVIVLGHLTEAQRRAYRIADNKLTELGEWDEALLRDEIAGLLAEDFDLTLLGISDDDLDALLRDPEALGGDGPVEGEDDVPDLPVAPVFAEAINSIYEEMSISSLFE